MSPCQETRPWWQLRAGQVACGSRGRLNCVLSPPTVRVARWRPSRGKGNPESVAFWKIVISVFGLEQWGRDYFVILPANSNKWRRLPAVFHACWKIKTAIYGRALAAGD